MITLSALEYDVLWEHLQLGPFPTVLRVDSHGATPGERSELTALAWESLADKGLGRLGAVHGRVSARLRRLARPEWELDARLRPYPTGPRTSALIATHGSRATVAVLHAGRLTLRTVPADRIARAALTLLPEHPPGTGTSITLPADLLDAAAARAGSDARAFAAALVSLGLGRDEAYKIADVTGTVIRFGQLGAARTKPLGSRRRAGHVVTVYDTPDGRYLFTRKPGDGGDWVTLLPGTETATCRQLDEILAELG
jgi:hypothetical protein